MAEYSTGFNPRSPCGERRGDWRIPKDGLEFQPTLPLRGATIILFALFGWGGFQPTLPLRGATADRYEEEWHIPFQPTLPLRGAT